MGFAAELHSYDSDIHQQLTFLAAKQYSKCAETQQGLYRPSALDVRYLVRANVAQADAGFFSRMFRWNYYSPESQGQKDVLWLIETRATRTTPSHITRFIFNVRYIFPTSRILY